MTGLDLIQPVCLSPLRFACNKESHSFKEINPVERNFPEEVLALASQKNALLITNAKAVSVQVLVYVHLEEEVIKSRVCVKTDAYMVKLWS